MPLTNFPQGVSSYGVPVLPQIGSVYGKHYFVDAKVGLDSYTAAQNDPTHPFLTMDRAFEVIKSGDTIHVRGKVREQLTTPVGVFDCTIIGAGNRPRHADDHTESNGLRGSSGATWTAPASGSTATPLLTLNQQGWRIIGITFQLSGSADACIYLHKTDDAGDDERDGAHAEIMYCKLQGTVGTPAGNGIEMNGIGFFKVSDCLLFGFENALKKVGAAGGQVGWCEIVNNRFDGNTNGIVSPLYHSVVAGNYFLSTHTVEIDLTGGASNCIVNNYFNGNDTFEVNVAASDDQWFPNYSSDSASADITAAPDMWVAALPNGS